jgi:predicted dehydrogenase
LGIKDHHPDIVNARLEIDLESGSQISVNITASRVSENKVRTWRMVENFQYWSLDLQRQRAKRVDWSTGQAQPLEINVPTCDQLTRQHSTFLDAIRAGRSFLIGGKDGLDAMALGHRIRSCLP